MLTVLNTLLPVFGIILAGYVFKYAGFPGRHFWPAAEKLSYYALFPCLLVLKLATTELQGEQPLLMSLALITAVLGVTAGLLVLSRFLPLTGRTFSSLYQGSIRFNTFVGFAAAAAFYGDTGLSLSAVAVAAMIPLINVFCVLVLQYFAQNVRADIKRTLLALVTNPLILACALGITLNLTGVGLNRSLANVMTIFSSAALPLGLLSVGAGIILTSLRDDILPIVLASFIKLIVLPLLVYFICQALGVDRVATRISIIFASLPTAISSYILARQLGGDAELMASIITVQTLLAVITMPIVLTFI